MSAVKQVARRAGVPVGSVKEVIAPVGLDYADAVNRSAVEIGVRVNGVIWKEFVDDVLVDMRYEKSVPGKMVAPCSGFTVFDFRQIVLFSIRISE